MLMSCVVCCRRNKWTMTHVQNATLAGGVAVGAVAGLLLYPWGALLLGCFAGVFSTLGYMYLQVSACITPSTPPQNKKKYVESTYIMCETSDSYISCLF